MDIPGIHAALIDHALTLGLFTSVSGHEPKAAPVLGGIHAAFWFDLSEPARGKSGLASTTMRLVWNLRIGQDMLKEPQDDIELDLLVASSAMHQAYSGDFELGGLVHEVDLLGEAGTPLSTRGGYLNHDNRLYRIHVVTIPLIVDDVFTQAP